MKFKYVILIALFASVFTGGCATATYHDRFGKAGSARGEFADFDARYKIYKGVLANESLTRDGKKYYHLQFEGAIGEGCLLNILIPYEYNTDPVLYDTVSVISTGKPAYLLVERTCCADDKKIFDHFASREMEADTEKMKKYLASEFPESSSQQQWPVIFCELTMTNVNKYSLIYKIWDPSKAVKDAALTGFSLEQPYLKMNLSWRRRSMVKYMAIKAGYVIPVLIDVITSPVQLVGIIIYFSMGGAVK